MAINVKEPPYNAVGNGIADDTTAIRNALAAAKCVYFPSGTYKVNLTTGPFSLSGEQKVYGDGHSTVIRKSDSSANAVFLLPSTGGHSMINDMMLEAYSTSPLYLGIGIQIGDTNFSGAHKIRNVRCRYFDKGIKLSGALYTSLYDCEFDFNNYGEVYEAPGSIYSTTIAHYSCTFNGNQKNGIAGLAVPVRNICLAYYSCLIEGNCISVPTTEPHVKFGSAAQITFNGCYFEDAKTVKSDFIYTNGMSEFTISNCYFNNGNKPIYGTSLANAAVIHSNRFLNTVGTNAVNLSALNEQIHSLGNASDKPIVINGTTCSVITTRIAQVP